MWLLFVLIGFAQEETVPDRIVFDAFNLQPSEWKMSPEVSVIQASATVSIRAGNVDSGWTTLQYDMPFTSETVIDLDLKQVREGRFSVQIEWLQEGGEFIAAVPLFPSQASAYSIQNQKLTEFLPSSGEPPKRFRLKLWTEGKGCEAQLSKFQVRAPRAWRSGKVRPIFSYEEKISTKNDTGVEAKMEKGILHAVLRPQKTSAAFLLKDPVPYEPKGVVMMDIQTLQGGSLELHALCWDNRGQFLKEIPLLKEISQSGLYETSFAIFTFPGGTGRVSFKIWLSGKETSVRISGLHYGSTS